MFPKFLLRSVTCSADRPRFSNSLHQRGQMWASSRKGTPGAMGSTRCRTFWSVLQNSSATPTTVFNRFALNCTPCRTFHVSQALMATEDKPVVSWKLDHSAKGEFVRRATVFRSWIKKDSEFPPEANRYHIYVSFACPWAHRTLVVRKLKGLEDVISFSTVHYHLGDGGWHFDAEYPDPLHPQNTFLKQVYLATDPEYAGRITVPVLFDKKTGRIVNNESSEIIRMLNAEFNHLAKNPSLDLYPEALQAKIEETNAWVYPNINDGVYKCGFARSQEAYSNAFAALFAHLDKAEAILSKSRYLTGSSLTEADVRLWTTLLRFDPVYFVHFKTNKKLVRDYPNLLAFTRELYQFPGVEETVNMFHIKHHYFESHLHINPFGIVPDGPELDYSTPHGRDKQTFEN